MADPPDLPRFSHPYRTEDLSGFGELIGRAIAQTNCAVARRYTPRASGRSSLWRRPGSETNWHSNTHLAVAH